MIKKVFHNKQAILGLTIITIILIVALFAPLIAKHAPNDVDIMNTFANPSAEYPLGTDEMGRCVFSRLVFGARNSLMVAIPTLIIIAILSTIVSVFCTYIGGIVDYIFSIVINIFMAFPPMLLAITLVGSFGNGYWSIVGSILISMWVWFARIIRTFVLEEMNKPYIITCKMSGCSKWRIVTKHILPNILPQLIVYFSTGIASIIITISSYSFLGIGFNVGTAEWGAMFSNSMQYMFSHKMLLIYPGLCILFTTAGFNLFGEALRDIISREDS